VIVDLVGDPHPYYITSMLIRYMMACRYSAVDTVYSTYKAILAALEMIVEGDDRVKAIKDHILREIF